MLIIVSVKITQFYLVILKIESIFADETYCVYDTNYIFIPNIFTVNLFFNINFLKIHLL